MSEFVEKRRYLIVGLGNPGSDYRDTRHNIGFRVLSRLAEDQGVRFSRFHAKSMVTQANLDGVDLVLAKPHTFMNLSGQAVSSLIRFYKIPLERLLIIHDDLDLPFGTIRIRPGGGAGGHKGLISIIQHLGGQQFPRLRMGIGKPPGRMDAADYVLMKFLDDEKQALPEFIGKAIKACRTFVLQGIVSAMNQCNGELDQASACSSI